MFAPKAANLQKNAASALAPQRSTTVGHRFGHNLVEQTLFLQRTILNQTTLQPLASHASSPNGNEFRDDSKGDAAPENTIGRESSRGISWDFTKIPLFAANRPNQFQMPSLVAALP